MQRREFLAAATGSALVAHAAPTGPPATATVTAEPGREIGRVDPMLYGHFLEHVERVVYGGIFEPGSRFADGVGIRQDVVAAVKEMGGAQVMRWPGGNFVSYYRWKDGVGPRERRPRRYDVAWRQQESNLFGTDEYLALCRQLGCEPFITANMGNGTIEEACQWVEYCRHAKRQPPVRIWGLGNEHYGAWQVGHYTAEEYARKALQFGRFMRAVEPDLRYVGVGYDEAWNAEILRRAGGLFDWLTVHLYAHRYHLDGVDDFDATQACAAVFEQELKKVADQIAAAEPRLRRERPLMVCLEEWNARHWKKGGGNAGAPGLERESPRDMADSLFTAGVFNACHRLSSRVTMTNYVFLLNAHGPLYVRPDGVLKTALFDVFRLYATRTERVAVAAEAASETFTARAAMGGTESRSATTGRVDVAATRSVDGKRLVLALLNRYRDRPCRVRLDVKGRQIAPGATLHELRAPSLSAVNSWELPTVIRSQTRRLEGRPEAVEIEPASVNFLEVTLA